MVRRNGSSFSVPSPAARDETKLKTIHEHASQANPAAADDDSARETRSKDKTTLGHGQSDDEHGKMEAENARLVKLTDALFEEVRSLKGSVKVLSQFPCPAAGCGAYFLSVRSLGIELVDAC